jgi:hypothetical protein
MSASTTKGMTMSTLRIRAALPLLLLTPTSRGVTWLSTRLPRRPDPVLSGSLDASTVRRTFREEADAVDRELWEEDRR